MNIKKIKKIPLRNVWNHEAFDFTKWLENNISYLNEALNLELTDLRSEEPVGNFKLDLFAQDESSQKTFVIENQLEKSNHDHLGKLLTYLVGKKASAAIWIVKEASYEHEKVMDFLNENLEDIDLYLVKLEAIQIEGENNVAPLFTLITGNIKEAKQIGKKQKNVLSDRAKDQHEFQKLVLSKFKEKNSTLFRRTSPNYWNIFRSISSVPKVSLMGFINQKTTSISLTFRLEKYEHDEILFFKKELEEKMKLSFFVEEFENKVRIRSRFNEGGLENKKDWDQIANLLSDRLIDLDHQLSLIFDEHKKKVA